MRLTLCVIACGLLVGLVSSLDTCDDGDKTFPLITVTDIPECHDDCNMCNVIFDEESDQYKDCLQHVPSLYKTLHDHCDRLTLLGQDHLDAFLYNLKEFCFAKFKVEIEITCPCDCECDMDVCYEIFNVGTQPYEVCLQHVDHLLFNSLSSHCCCLSKKGGEYFEAFLYNLVEFCKKKFPDNDEIEIPTCPSCVNVTCDPCVELMDSDGEFVTLCEEHLCPGELETILAMCHEAVVNESPRQLWLTWEYVQHECAYHAKLTAPLDLPICNCEDCLNLFNHTDDFMTRCGSLLGDCVGDVLWPECEFSRCDPDDWKHFLVMLDYVCNEYSVSDVDFPEPCETEPVPCDTHLDIVFVMDHSDSINRTEFQNEKAFIEEIYRGFNIDDDHVRVGIVNFGSSPHRYIELDEENTREILDTKMEAMVPMPGLHYTWTGEALLDMLDMFTETNIGNPMAAIIVTDGYSNGMLSLEEAVEATADRFPDLVMYSVGTFEARLDELMILAQDNEDHMFYVYESADLYTLVEGLVELVCIEH